MSRIITVDGFGANKRLPFSSNLEIKNFFCDTILWQLKIIDQFIERNCLFSARNCEYLAPGAKIDKYRVEGLNETVVFGASPVAHGDTIL